MTTKLTHIIFLPYSTLIFRKFKSKWKNRRECKISMAILAIHVKNFPITRSVFSLITFLQESKSEARASCLNIWVSAFNIINWLFSNYSPQMGMSHPCFRQNTFPYLPVRVSYKPKQLQALKMKKGREKGKEGKKKGRKRERGRERREEKKKRQLKKLLALCISFFSCIIISFNFHFSSIGNSEDMVASIFFPKWEITACHCRRLKRRGFDLQVGKIPWRRKWQPTPVFMPGESYGQRSMAGYGP